MKHTPGPWKVASKNPHAVNSIDYGCIAWTPNEPAENDAIMAEMQANAHLIAVAPDLLEALRQISTIMTGSKAQMENQIQFARSTAKQAIRKAEDENA